MVAVFGAINTTNGLISLTQNKRICWQVFACELLALNHIYTTWLIFIFLQTITALGVHINERSSEKYLVFLFLIPAILTTAIQILRHKYYGVFKLLWIAPIIVWAITLSVPICGILDDLGIVEIW